MCNINKINILLYCVLQIVRLFSLFQGRLLFANYGEKRDFETLRLRYHIDNCSDTIVIMKYGRLFRGDKVCHCKMHNLINILYESNYLFHMYKKQKIDFTNLAAFFLQYCNAANNFLKCFHLDKTCYLIIFS